MQRLLLGRAATAAAAAAAWDSCTSARALWTTAAAAAWDAVGPAAAGVTATASEDVVDCVVVGAGEGSGGAALTEGIMAQAGQIIQCWWTQCNTTCSCVVTCVDGFGVVTCVDGFEGSACVSVGGSGGSWTLVLQLKFVCVRRWVSQAGGWHHVRHAACLT